jgi:hypothetical protein
MRRSRTFLVGCGAAHAARPVCELATARVASFSPDVDRLWEACAPELETTVVRDRAYLNWRYAAHPSVDYSMIEVRSATSGDLRGIAVLREGGWDPQVLSLCDWAMRARRRPATAVLESKPTELPMCLITRSLLVAAASLGSLSAQRGIFVVDASNGPGTHYTDIQAAVIAVPDGSTLLVRDGAYGAVTIDGKGLTILCAANVTVSHPTQRALTISGTQPGQVVTVRECAC